MAVSGVWILGGAVLAGRLQQVRYSWLAATGLIIGLLTRPFESFFFVVPLVLWQLWGLLRCVGGNGASKWSSKLAAPICVGVVAGVFALGAYNNCITGNWKMFPHTFYENIYTPHGVRFLWEQKAESDRNAFFRSLPQPFHQLKEHYLQKHQERMEHLVLSKAQKRNHDCDPGIKEIFSEQIANWPQTDQWSAILQSSDGPRSFQPVVAPRSQENISTRKCRRNE